MKAKRRFGLILLLGAVAAQGQPTALKMYQDAEYGVRFQYPADWTADVGVPSRIVFNPENDPLARFGWKAPLEGGPYAGTTLSDIVFVYNVVPGQSASECGQRIEANLNPRPVERRVRGVTYEHYRYAGAWSGHQDSGEVYVTASGGRCYLFEETVHTQSGRTGPRSKILTDVQFKQLDKKLDKVMRSVRFDHGG